jgi:RNA recognition motif. (a.k.a. RRM, RBD, or RNP domain)
MDNTSVQVESLQAQSPAVADAEQAKLLFVGGLPLEVTESQLYNYFRKFGELSRCDIPSTTQTKKKKFAFVEFVSPNDALTVSEVPLHVIDGAEVKIERALSAAEIFEKQLQASKCKLFVSGDLIAKTNSLLISKEISALGQVERVKKLKCASKTFNSCFVTMKSIADAEYLLEQKSLVLPTLKKVTFKRFVPRRRDSTDELATEDLPITRLNFTSSEGNPHNLGEDSKQIKQITEEKFFGIRRTITIRPGLCILSGIGKGWNSGYQANRLILLDHMSSIDPSSKNDIRILDRNLRFNISGLPSAFHTNNFKAEPAGSPKLFSRYS